MKYALVEPSGRVAEVRDEPFPVARSLQWIECGGDVLPEWRHGEDGFTAPSPLPAIEKTPDRVDRILSSLQAKGLLTAAEVDALK